MSRSNNNSGNSSGKIAQAAEQSYEAIATILNSLDALVYVADMQTHELLFFNDYGRSVWGEPEGRKCYQVLQQGQDSPCAFCTNDKLLNAQGEPAGVYVWEFQNTRNGRWYQCRDQAIRWIDGRLVRMEIATDITDLKLLESELEEAKGRAERLADTDELTGLYNRRAFFSYAGKAYQQSLRNARPVAVIMFDVDHFKRVNDHWGHPIGDKALKALADVSLDTARASDVVARLGGEEFAVFLPDTDAAAAFALADRLRQAIARRAVVADGDSIFLTASFGVAASEQELFERPRSPVQTQEALGDLLQRADRALLQAKQAGRNRVMAELGSL